MKRLISLFLAVLMMLSLAACGGSEPPADTGGSETPSAADGENGSTTVSADEWFYLAISDAASLSPLGATENEALLMGFSQATLYRKLPTADGMGTELVPELAAGAPVDVNGDGITWNIEIAPEAKWHTDDPITAETFEFSMKMALDPKLPAAQVDLLAHSGITIKNARAYYTGQITDWSKVGVKAMEGNILQITAERACIAEDVMRHFSGYWTAPVHEELYTSGLSADGTSTTYGTSKDLTGYSGPYAVTGRAPGYFLRLKRNPNYLHAENFGFNNVQMYVAENPTVAAQLFVRGEVDYVTLDSVHAEQFAQDPRMTAVPSRDIRMIDFGDMNTKQPILSNRNFRKAVYYGIDRQAVAALMGALPAAYVVPSATKLGSTDVAFRNMPEAQAYLPQNNGYDPDAAAAYLDKALKEEGLASVEVKLLYNAGGNDRIIAEYLKEQFAAIFGGRLMLKLDPVPESLYLFTREEWKTNPNAYEMALSCTSFATWDHNPAEVFGVHTTDYANRSGVCPRHSDAINALYARSVLAENRKDTQKLAELAMEMEKAFIDEVVAVPIVEDVTYVMCSEKVETPFKTVDPALGCGVHFGRFVQ